MLSYWRSRIHTVHGAWRQSPASVRRYARLPWRGCACRAGGGIASSDSGHHLCLKMRGQLLDVLHVGDRHVWREGQRRSRLLSLGRAGWQWLLLLRERRLLLWSLGLHANLLRLLHGEAACCLLGWKLVLRRRLLLRRLLMVLLLLLVREGRRSHSGSLSLPLLLCIEWLLDRRTSCWWCSCMIWMCLEWLLLLLWLRLRLEACFWLRILSILRLLLLDLLLLLMLILLM